MLPAEHGTDVPGGCTMAVTTASDLYYDPKDPTTAFDPHPVFRRLRDEAPLYHNEELGFYALSRFENIEHAYIDKERFSSAHGVTLDIMHSNEPIPPGTVIFEDPPVHTIHRALLARMFTARRVSELEQWIRRLCADLLDPFVGTGGFDFTRDLARELPMRVICKLVGYPEEMQEVVRAHSSVTPGEDDGRSTYERLDGALFGDYIDWRADNPSDDVITLLLNAEFTDHDGSSRRLTCAELLAYVNIVASAGNDTTARMISWIGKLLSDHPDQLRLLARDRSLVPQAVEEVLRYEPVSLQAGRWVTEDVQLHGATVPKDSVLMLLGGSANRDERHIADPDRFDITRTPGQIMSFGWGVPLLPGTEPGAPRAAARPRRGAAAIPVLGGRHRRRRVRRHRHVPRVGRAAGGNPLIRSDGWSVLRRCRLSPGLRVGTTFHARSVGRCGRAGSIRLRRPNSGGKPWSSRATRNRTAAS